MLSYERENIREGKPLMKFVIWIFLRILLAPVPNFLRKRIMKVLLGAYKESQNTRNGTK